MEFLTEIYMQIYILLPFGVVLGDGRKYILFPVFLLRAAGNPSHPRDRHLCSQSEREEDEGVEGTEWGGVFPYGVRRSVVSGNAGSAQAKNICGAFLAWKDTFDVWVGGIVAALISL